MIAEHGKAELLGTGGTGSARQRLLAEEMPGNALRITLIHPEGAQGIVVDALSQQAMEDELSLLRKVVESAPMMMMRRNQQGELVWVNSAYLRAADHTTRSLAGHCQRSCRTTRPGQSSTATVRRSGCATTPTGSNATNSRTRTAPPSTPCPPMPRCGPSKASGSSFRR